MFKPTPKLWLDNINIKTGVFYRLFQEHAGLSSNVGSHTPIPNSRNSGVVFSPKQTGSKTDIPFRNVTSQALIRHLLSVYIKPTTKKNRFSVRRGRVVSWGRTYNRLGGSALAVGPFLKHTATLRDAAILSCGRALGTPVASVFSRSLMANGPHLVNTVNHLGTKQTTPTINAKPYSFYQSDMRKVRMRFERWFFTNLGCRTYVWFSDIWKTIKSELDAGCLSGMYSRCVRQLTRRGNRFILRAAQAYVTFQSIVLAVTSVTGLQFFMKMTMRLLKRHRSHWAVLMYMLGFFNVCKNHFWFKTLYQYRLVVRGKFGGYMRASQKVFQHGIVKIHQWDLKINYYRLCPVTKYGVFSVRFWLQMRDMRKVRYAALTGNISGAELLGDHSGAFPINL